MGINRRFYWLKLHENFFNRASIRFLRKLPDGDTIVIIYLELLCISLSSDGYIYTNGFYSSIEEDIALMLDEDVMHVKLTLAALEQSNLVSKGTEEQLFMKEFPQVVGSETASTRRVREYRKREKEITEQGVESESVTMKHQCNALETNGNADETKCNTEKEIEIETEIEKEIESEREGEKETFLCGTYHNVRLSQTDLEKLQERFPNDYRQKIERLSRYMHSSGKSYKNHYLTICKWAKQDEKRSHNEKQSGFPDYSVKEGESY